MPYYIGVFYCRHSCYTCALEEEARNSCSEQHVIPLWCFIAGTSATHVGWWRNKKPLCRTACHTVLVVHCRYFCYTCGLVEDVRNPCLKQHAILYWCLIAGTSATHVQITCAPTSKELRNPCVDQHAILHWCFLLQALLLHMCAGGGSQEFLFRTACHTTLVFHGTYSCYTCGLLKERRNFCSEQHTTLVFHCRYFCYTCGLVDSKGCCSACAQVCHAGHDLVYSTHSRFFCDCGAGVPRYAAASVCVDLMPVTYKALWNLI